METIKVFVSWCDKNFGATLGDNVPGSVVVTAKTYEELQSALSEALRFHVEGMVEDGDDVADWLKEGDYTFDYSLDTAALLQRLSKYITISAISRVTGMNKRQLSHYANGTKRPRGPQRSRIVEGLHKIGKDLVSVV